MKPFARMILALSLALAAGCVSGQKVDNTPVAALDLNRYLGEWYEIARFDHSFERGVEHGGATAWLRCGRAHLGASRKRRDDHIWGKIMAVCVANVEV